jgi:hypothetical protein
MKLGANAGIGALSAKKQPQRNNTSSLIDDLS